MNARSEMAGYLRTAETALDKALSMFQLTSLNGKKHADADEMATYGSLKRARTIVLSELATLEALRLKED